MKELDVTKTVKKSNMLNEIRDADASVVEYRLFCVYLAHLPISSDDNVVTFTLADYARIAGLDRPRRKDLEVQSRNLLKLTATMDSDDGGFVTRNLFSEFRLFKENGEWIVSLECNQKIAPQIREQKGKFLRYKLYNTMFLKSYNQQRMYELLKQYEKIGERSIELKDLRAFLSIKDSEYQVWYDFSSKVLKVAQKALKEHTDICFDYEPIKKKTKTVGVKFLIWKNKEFVDRYGINTLMAEEGPIVTYDEDEGGFTVRADDADSNELEGQTSMDEMLEDLEQRTEICLGFDDDIFLEFTCDELLELKELASPNISTDDIDRHDKDLGNRLMAKEYAISEYIRRKIRYCDAYPDKVENRYKFIRAAVKKNWE